MPLHLIFQNTTKWKLFFFKKDCFCMVNLYQNWCCLSDFLDGGLLLTRKLQ